MTRLPLPEGPTTFPACDCDQGAVELFIPRNHDRAGGAWWECPKCGSRAPERVERICLPDLNPRLEPATC